MIKLQFIADYLRHIFTAKTRHGVHSPFAYKLIDEVIYDFRAKPDYEEIEAIRQDLLVDTRTFQVKDLGAGSLLNNNKHRSVNSIAKNALKPPKLSQLLYRLAHHQSPTQIIELGTCLGITTAYLSKASPEAIVLSIEGCPATAAIARETLQKSGSLNARVEVGNFDDLFPALVDSSHALDFVFIDGNHRKDATLDYFYKALPKLHENSIVIFDDIYWSRGMKEAWDEVKNHPEVTVTIDLFWIGLVFVRRPQAKENFKVRY